MRYLSVFFWIILLGLITLFVALNSHSISLDYYLGTISISLPWLLFICLLLGVLLGVFSILSFWLRSKTACRRLKAQLLEAQKKINTAQDIE